MTATYRVVAPPEEVAPVDPLVPELLLVPAEPPVEGVVAVELPDAPMPERVPELDVAPGLLEVDVPLGLLALVEEGDTEPPADPPAEPMPDAVPDAEPDIVEPQAARAAAREMGTRIFSMLCSLNWVERTERRVPRSTEVQLCTRATGRGVACRATARRRGPRLL